MATGFGAQESPDAPLKETILPGLELLVSRPLEEVVQNSTWNNRAWTFQERILSRRCLVFVEGRVYFQCRGANMSQDVYPGGLDNEEAWSLDWRDSPLRTLRDAKERPIWFYMKCVSLYTGRRLTLPKDIVPAFIGVSQLMARYMDAPFFYCLPASHFDFALLWQPSREQKRCAREAFPTTSKPEDTLGDDWFDHEEFPSWSWAGWMDHEDPQKGAHVTTWIDWNIRDGDGNVKNIATAAASHGSLAPPTDNYGRPIRYTSMNRCLSATIADNPFGIRASQQRMTDTSFTLPILQFHTWSSNFFISESSPEESTEPLGEGLARCHVADQSHDWCGTVVLDQEWATAHSGTPCRFIALSEAKSFTADECTHWAHYIAKDRDEIEWDLFHVLLVRHNSRRLLWERVGVGKVLQQAFDMTKESWTEILLG
ncbi:hypothetical protein GE09DRAFT_1294941 [Coniochaeta sp. 2T2.1]|nr:hypothetical protein GE09DRAFT_1294941 [Coniochaeta sp. 2T2.1]